MSAVQLTKKIESVCVGLLEWHSRIYSAEFNIYVISSELTEHSIIHLNLYLDIIHKSLAA